MKVVILMQLATILSVPIIAPVKMVSMAMVLVWKDAQILMNVRSIMEIVTVERPALTG